MSQRTIAIAALVWTLALVVSHLSVPDGWQWGMVAAFSVSMNLVYPWQAISSRSFQRTELSVAAVLIILSVMGAFLSPWLLVVAVAGHAVWDTAKHKGAGVPFFSWYTFGCAVIDLLWAAALVALILQAS